MYRYVGSFLLKGCARCFHAFLPYRLYVSLVIHLLRIDGNKFSDQRVLCFSRALFDKDYEQLSYRLRDYGWIWFDKSFFTVCLNGLIPKYARGQKKYAEFLDDPEVKWSIAIKKAQALVSELKKRRGISCFVTANIDYYQDHAFKVACKKEGVPVVVLQKEFPVTGRVAKKFEEHYKGWDPNADFVAVAGDRAKKCLEECGVGDYASVVVTGLPRLDRYKSIDCTTKKREKLKFVVLSFRSGYGENSEAGFFDLVNVVAELVNSESELLIKAKNKLDQKEILAWLQGNIDSSTRRNIHVSSEIPLYDAFSWASLIIGHNSLSTMEALLTPRPVIVPAYLSGSEDGKIITEAQCDGCGVELLASKSHFGSKVDELMPMILSGINTKEQRARQKVLSDYWMWENDVTACERFGIVIGAALKKC